MRRRYGWGLGLAVLVACSGTASSVGPVDDGADAGDDAAPTSSDVDAEDGEPDAGSGDVDDARVPSTDAEDDDAGGNDATTDATTDDADATVDPIDSGSDASQLDAGADGGADPKDAGGSVDAGSDGGTPTKDAGTNPTTCSWGDTRCKDYRLDMCDQNGTWQWQMGFQDCCYDARFVVGQQEVLDTTTGKTWLRTVGRGSGAFGANQLCDSKGGRLPTKEELMEILIGTPVNNFSVCSPTIDQHAWVGVQPGKAWASNGCVDLIRGEVAASCAEADPFICVKK